jgi:hypothetical protein
MNKIIDRKKKKNIQSIQKPTKSNQGTKGTQNRVRDMYQPTLEQFLDVNSKKSKQMLKDITNGMEV